MKDKIKVASKLPATFFVQNYFLSFNFSFINFATFL